MTAKDYEQMMLLHLCDSCDCINARFVWMRAPEALRKRSAELEQIWGICEALKDHDFKSAFGKLTAASPLHSLLRHVLQTSYVPNLVAKSYAKIDRTKLAEMLGVASDKDLVETLAKSNFTAKGDKFVNLEAKREMNCSEFSLNETRVQ